MANPQNHRGADNSLFEELARSTPDGILVIDTKGTVIYANEAAIEMLGEGAIPLLGQELGHPAVSNAVTEIDLVARHGPPRVAELRSVPIQWRNEQARLVAVRDITEHRRVEATLRDKMERLDRANRNLDQFAAAVSHDLRSPLLTIKAYLTQLTRTPSDQLVQASEQRLPRIVSAAERMGNIIEGLLAVCRSEQQDETGTVLDVEAALEGVLANVATLIEDTEAVITQDRMPAITTGPVPIQIIFQNLIENAIKYRGESAPRVHISAKRDGSNWIFSVSDNGIGISEEHQDNVFGLYERSGTNDTAQPGLGIGLSTCKRILENHGGSIRFESIPGRGTTFYFTLPVMEDASQAHT